MAWSTPYTFVVNEIVTAAVLNTYMRDNFRYLKGLDGNISLDAELGLSGNALTNVSAVDGVDVSTLSSNFTAHDNATAAAGHTTIGAHTHETGAQGDTIALAGLSEIVSGTYVGNGATTARQITTGFAINCGIIFDSNGNKVYFLNPSTSSSMSISAGIFPNTSSSVHAHATDGFVVADGSSACNVNAITYYYVMFAEE